MRFKKLVLYSGGQERSNHNIHRALVSLVGPKSRIKFTYIPFCTEGSRVYYRRAVRRYSYFGVTDFHYLSVDQKFHEGELEEALRSDIIYLAGGNTFYFLKHLRKSGMLPLLRAFVESGGILAGLSAGGLIMTPHIFLAGYPGFECDENDVNLKNLKALKLVNFEFFPHYVNSKKLNNALLDYSEKTKFPIYASRDGGGIVVNGDQKTFFGETVVFLNGRKFIV
ncbi:MAG: Type 1 glutamine amidotransferase-like domain-containing protein [Bdellovibrionales bacterium]|nr:Type 1 glutamine amidotransferase-like domain-containing protein [Bdellovibrionales bacterium]